MASHEETGNPGFIHPHPELQPAGPGGHPDDRHGEARKNLTLTDEELLDARKAAAWTAQEDAGHDPGEAHSDNQGHDSEGAWRQDTQGKVTLMPVSSK